MVSTPRTSSPPPEPLPPGVISPLSDNEIASKIYPRTVTIADAPGKWFYNISSGGNFLCQSVSDATAIGGTYALYGTLADENGQIMSEGFGVTLGKIGKNKSFFDAGLRVAPLDPDAQRWHKLSQLASYKNHIAMYRLRQFFDRPNYHGPIRSIMFGVLWEWMSELVMKDIINLRSEVHLAIRSAISAHAQFANLYYTKEFNHSFIVGQALGREFINISLNKSISEAPCHAYITPQIQSYISHCVSTGDIDD